MYVFDASNISPVAVTIGFIDIRWYSLAYICGLICAYIVVSKQIKQSNITNNISNHKKFMDSLLTYSAIGVLLGGRMGYVLLYNPIYYSMNVMDIFKIWQGGMSFHGGLIGVIIAIYLFSRKSYSFLQVTDIVAPSVPIGLFFGRLANFMNHELVGRPTSKLIGVVYYPGDQPHHPSQLYEALLEGILLFLILQVLIYKTNVLKQVGVVSSIFLIIYSIFRFFIEFSRAPDQHIGYIFHYITYGQILSTIMFIAGVGLYINRKKHS